MFLQIPTKRLTSPCPFAGSFVGRGEAAFSRPRELCWLVLEVEDIEIGVGGEEAEAAKGKEFQGLLPDWEGYCKDPPVPKQGTKAMQLLPLRVCTSLKNEQVNREQSD